MRGPTPKYYLGFGSTWTTLDADIVWTEVTDKVMSERGVSTSRGRSSELDDMRAGTGSLVLKNDDRRFDPTHTTGPYYATYLNATGASGSYASTPDVAALDIVGDLDIRVRVSADDWTPSANQALIAKWDQASGNQRAWFLRVDATTGALSLNWSADGTAVLTKTSTASPTVTDGDALWVRATLDVNNGAAGNDVKFYTSTDSTRDHSLVSWTQLGSTVTTAGTTSIFNSSAVASVGGRIDAATNLAGKVYAAAILDGIGGTVVADPVFSIGAGVGASSVTDATGKVWTVNSPATITGTSSHLKPGVPVKVTGTANSTEYPVLRGFVNGWPQDYDVSNRLATVNVGITDGMAKLATAGTPSSVYALEVAADTPKVWWRLGEATGPSIADGSGNKYDATLPPGEPIRTADHPNPYETASAFDANGDLTVRTTDSAARITDDPYTLEAIVTVGDLTDTTQRDIIRQSDADAGAFFSVGVLGFGGTNYRWVIRTHMAGEVTDAQWNTANIDITTLSTEPYWHVVVRRNGGTHTLYLNGSAQALTSVGGDTNSNKTYEVSAVGGNAGWIGLAADIAIYPTDIGTSRISDHYEAITAPWDGDTTGARLERILGFGPWPSDLVDLAPGYTTLGPATLGSNQLQLIKGYEKAEQGRFFISRAGKATFLDRYYNQLVTAGSTSQATFSDDGSDNAYCSIAFDYDDRLVYNRVRGSRTGGSQLEVVDQDSIDTYGEQVDSSLTGIQVGTDALVRGAVELRLDRYKEPQLRVRPIELKLHGMTAAQQADILDLELGYRVTVERTPQGVGSAITQETVVEGISHRISGGQWSTVLTMSPVDTREYGLWGDNWDEAVWGY